MSSKPEAHIDPVDGDSRKIDLTVSETYKERFGYIGAVSNMLWEKRLERTFKLAGAAVLTGVGIIELSKPVAPLLSPDLMPLTVNPFLNQVSGIAENPWSVGILAGIGAVTLTRSAFRNLPRYQAIAAELRRVRLCPPRTKRHDGPPHDQAA